MADRISHAGELPGGLAKRHFTTKNNTKHGGTSPALLLVWPIEMHPILDFIRDGAR